MNKNILMIVFSSYPEDIRVRKEAEALVESGFSVDVICLKNRHKVRRAKVDGVNVYRINLQSQKGSKLRYLWEYFYFVMAVSFRTLFSHIYKKYAVIHVHNVPNIIVICALIPRLFRVKMILDMHENVPELFVQRFNMNANGLGVKFLIFLEKISVQFVDHVIVATPFIKKLIQNRSLSDKGCTVLLNLSDPKFFTNIHKRDTETNKPFQLIYPGTLSHHHGIDLAIRAVFLIKQKGSIDLQFHLYGIGAEKNALINLVKQLALENEVLFHDRVEFEELVSIMSEMDLGLVPKRDGIFVGEAISTKLFDFAAIGLPAVVSNTSGDSLYFDESMVSFFEPENVEHMAEKIIYLYHNPELRRRMSDNMLALSRKLNWDIIKQDLCKVYSQLTSE